MVCAIVVSEYPVSTGRASAFESVRRGKRKHGRAVGRGQGQDRCAAQPRSRLRSCHCSCLIHLQIDTIKQGSEAGLRGRKAGSYLHPSKTLGCEAGVIAEA